MKKIVKGLLVFIFLVFFVLPVMAGGQKDDSPVGDAPITLSYWHLWGGSRTELIEDLMEKFQKKHPNVEFEVTFTPPNELQKKIVQAAGTNTLPDVVQIHSGWYTIIQPELTLENLDSYIVADDIDLEDILVAAEAKRSYWHDSVYSLPNVNSGAQGLFFYNKGLMRKAGLDPVTDAPATWAEFVEVSGILVEKLNSGSELDVIAWDPNQMAGQPAVIMFSYGKGSPTVSDDGKVSMMNSSGVVQTAEAFDDYINDIYGDYGGYRGVLEWNSRVAGADTGAAQVQAFINENQVFYVSGSWTIGQVQSANPDLELGIISIPGFNGQHGGTAKNGWSYAMSKSSKNKAMAWEFLKFITIETEGNGEFCIAQGRPSPISSVNQDPSYKAMGEMWDNLVASMNKDIVPVSPDIDMDTLKPLLRDIPSRRIAGESIQEIMMDIHDRYQDFLDDINS